MSRSFVSVIASLGIVLAGWRLGSAALTDGSGSSAVAAQAAAPTAQTSATDGTATDGTAGASTATAAGTGLKDGSYTGAAARNQFGSWTVSVTVSGGKITDVSATTTASDGQSRRIASYAVPTLRSEVLAAQSAKVSAVSGATYTSESYLSSLQSALDKANG